MCVPRSRGCRPFGRLFIRAEAGYSASPCLHRRCSFREPHVNHSSNPPAGEPQSSAGDPQPAEAPHSDFAPTRPDEDGEHPSGWWPESADGQCSEHAALFAASQPAPLSVV
jgi:hypothetical protein